MQIKRMSNGGPTLRSRAQAGGQLMRPLAELRVFHPRCGANFGAPQKDLAGYEIYCATAEHRIARINYTSDIPSRGLEEFKSLQADGFQLRVAMRRDNHEVGAAFEAGDFTADSVRAAVRRARSARRKWIRISPVSRRCRWANSHLRKRAI